MEAILFLVVGFFILIKGADWLVDGAAALARRLKVSDLIIGLTVVAFGTSTPELIVNIFAALRNTPQIAIGNILGSNIANVLLILGISAIIFPLKVTQQTVWREIPLGVLAAVMVFVLTRDRFMSQNVNGMLSKVDGVILLGMFVFFLWQIFRAARKDEETTGEDFRKWGVSQSVLRVALGLGALLLGGNIVATHAVKLARAWGVSESFIGLTIVAVGTSLPELATSVVAAYKKNANIAVGNIVGSNIFNIFFILGISALIRPLPFMVANNADILIMIVSSLSLFLFMFTGGKKMLDRWEGVLFLLGYVLYIAFLFIRR